MEKKMSDNFIDEKVKKIISDTLNVDIERVVPDANFLDDLDADSLDSVELVMKIEEEFGVEVSDKTAETFIKVSDVISFIEKNVK